MTRGPPARLVGVVAAWGCVDASFEIRFGQPFRPALAGVLRPRVAVRSCVCVDDQEADE